jgi:2-polyprenyl-3-methyl-5-hydroxy-6-metoxy-1,4-benzoquinol methylase
MPKHVFLFIAREAIEGLASPVFLASSNQTSVVASPHHNSRSSVGWDRLSVEWEWMAMGEEKRPYRAPLRFSWLTHYYDLIVGCSINDRLFKEQLLAEADIAPGQRVLDFGCGTGSMTIRIKERVPSARIVGIDIDRQILNLARAKAEAKRIDIDWRHGTLDGFASELGTMDHIVSSLVFHHLTTDEKRSTLRQLLEVLRPGGEIHIADFGMPRSWLMQGAFLSVRILDGFDRTEANYLGQLPILMADAGLSDVRSTHTYSTVCGTIELFHGRRD